VKLLNSPTPLGRFICCSRINYFQSHIERSLNCRSRFESHRRLRDVKEACADLVTRMEEHSG